MNDSNTPQTRSNLLSPLSILAGFVGLAILAIVLIWGASKFLIGPAGNLIEKSITAFTRVFNLAPQTTIKGDSVVLEKSSIAELAVVARKTSTLIKYQSTWSGSTKTLIVRADFIAKAGFDLNQSFRMQVDKTTGDVTVDFPKPKVLSVDLKHYEVIFSSDGVINKLQQQDQEAVVRALIAKAREDADTSDMTEEAIHQVNTRVQDLLFSTARKITVRYNNIEVPDIRQLQ